ncbi:hypothetical protein ILUMI_21216 [Ignelater luminosus]|uniref:DDE Tnp4 domain-containing protein n=1 Tax=Ignelater luminosus TaxID=2038154 RepID=A0A8K0G3W2_IGNLU|nr:hypothetical protein ILUMI_21216 [Ignelater luminosus]
MQAMTNYKRHSGHCVTSDVQIRDVFVGYPGSVPDSRVFRTSPLAQTLCDKCHDMHILRDRRYPLLSNLLNPFKDCSQLTRAQRNYHLKLAKNRNVMEHCFGLLKQESRQLYHGFDRTSCVLHNLAPQNEFQLQDAIEHNSKWKSWKMKKMKESFILLIALFDLKT